MLGSALDKPHLPPDYATAIAFLDESGAIASDRFFAVGCLKLGEPTWLLRRVQRWRDQSHWYQEIHFGDLTSGTLDRLLDSRRQSVRVVVRKEVNRRLGCLGVPSVVRIDSKAAVPLQLVDLLTSALAFEFRQDAGLGGTTSPKAGLAAHVGTQFKVATFLKGVRTPKLNVHVYRRGTSLAANSANVS
jgi:hypothetical protein